MYAVPVEDILATERIRDWVNATNRSAFVDDSVHVWIADLDREPSFVGDLFALLSQEERTRAGKFRFPVDQNRFIIRRGFLRKILADYLQLEPQTVQFGTGEFGKLYVLSDSHDHGFEFNVTHSNGIALIALARARCVGVDLEHVRPIPDFESIINYSLSNSERCHIQTLPKSLQLDCFYRYWTCKEAYLKGLGVGLSRPLDSVSVSISSNGSARQALLEDDTQESLGLSVLSFIPVFGYVAAIATIPRCGRHEFFVI